MPDTYDVVIVGGAVMGSSVAYHLLSAGAFGGRVAVIEKDPTYRRSASALSAASIRQQFSTPVNIHISLHGIAFLRKASELLEVNGERPEIAFKGGGYLYVASAAGVAALAENHALQTQEGADILLMDQADLKNRFPWLNVKDLAAAAWGRSGEGWFDGWALLQAFRRKGRALGATYFTGEVVAIERAGHRITAVRLRDGSRIGCGMLVNCAGAGGRAVAALAGIDLPVHARRRDVFTFTCPERITDCPLLIDTSGVYVRPEGDGFICGASPRGDEPDPDWRDDDPASQEPDWTVFENRLWPTLAERVPAFETLRPGRAWSGPYDLNSFDQNAILGRAGTIDNVYLCNGFSGHGLQQAPAVGRGLAELIVHGRYVTLDLSDLAFERIAANRPLRERNVI
jgi:FAD-dependent oxidoreductase domain-containing protein 1